MLSSPFPLEEGCWGRQNVQAPTTAQEKTEQEQETGNSRCWDQVGSGQGGRKAESWDSGGWHNGTKTSCYSSSYNHELKRNESGGQMPLICTRHNVQLQKQGSASWRLVLFNPNLSYNAAVCAQQGALSHDEITCSTSYTSQSYNIMVVQTGRETSFWCTFMKLVWNQFWSVCQISVIIKMKFHLMATFSLVLQPNSGLLHYLTSLRALREAKTGWEFLWITNLRVWGEKKNMGRYTSSFHGNHVV